MITTPRFPTPIKAGGLPLALRPFSSQRFRPPAPSNPPTPCARETQLRQLAEDGEPEARGDLLREFGIVWGEA